MSWTETFRNRTLYSTMCAVAQSNLVKGIPYVVTVNTRTGSTRIRVRRASAKDAEVRALNPSEYAVTWYVYARRVYLSEARSRRRQQVLTAATTGHRIEFDSKGRAFFDMEIERVSFDTLWKRGAGWKSMTE